MNKYPQYYLVTGSQGRLHQRDGLDTSFTGTVANVTVSNAEQYDRFWAARLEFLRANEKAD
jgi:hypothetical protein